MRRGTRRHAAWPESIARCLVLATMSQAGAGCRASLDDDYRGTIGEDDAALTLEQQGAALEGELCYQTRCEGLTGNVVDRRVTLRIECEGCVHAGLRLDLDVRGDELDGHATVPQCTCTDDGCDCRLHARFWPDMR